MLEGRLIWFLMSKAAFHENQDLEENIMSQQRHRMAMMQSSLPTDFLVRMVRHFIPQPGEEFSKFQDFHREACLLLEIHRKQYRKRKLKSNSLVLAVFMMIEMEVEESEDEQVKRMFVEVYGDRDSFLGAFVAELDKTDEIEKEMRVRQPRMTRHLSMGQVEDEVQVITRGLDNNSSITNLINGLQHMEVAKVMRFMKIFPKKTRDESAWALGIAHPRLKKDLILKDIPIQLTGQQTTMQFTKMTSNQWAGRAATQAAVCTSIAFNSLEEDVKERLKELFEPILRKVMEQPLLEEDVSSDEEEERASEDYPRYGQSQTQNTLKTCTFCEYLTRYEADMNRHIEEEHPKCEQCDTRTQSETALTEHKNSVHNLFKCNICKQSVPTTESVEHMKMHSTQEQYNKEIMEGPKKAKPHRGWNTFLKTKKAELKAISPTMTHQLLTAQVSALWKALSKAEKQMWNLRAVQEEEAQQRQEQEEQRQVQVAQRQVQVDQRQVQVAQTQEQTQQRQEHEEQRQVEEEQRPEERQVEEEQRTEQRQVEEEQRQVQVEETQGQVEETQVQETQVQEQRQVEEVLEVLEQVTEVDVDQLLQDNEMEDDLTFSAMENVVFGTEEVPGPASLHCPLCAYSFMDKNLLDQHIEETHPDSQERELGARRKVLVDMSCPHCDFQTESKESFRLHMKDHKLRQTRLSTSGGLSVDTDVVPTEVVLHKVKKLEWPGIVRNRCGNKVTIELLNRARSTREVDVSTIRPFAMAPISAKNSELRHAYQEAQKAHEEAQRLL